jgi:hypothetical protein
MFELVPLIHYFTYKNKNKGNYRLDPHLHGDDKQQYYGF